MLSTPEPLGCEVIQGNPDFYGLGIRISVYLQWVTTWINFVVDPQSAQAAYDINSVFVFALLVATMIATLAEEPTIQPVETHIMLQFVLGFFVTTLSTFGLRYPASSSEQLPVCMLVATNIWLWFASQSNYRLAGQTCDPPFIFTFSKQQLSGPIVNFCKAVSIIIAVVVYPPF
ncbi:hypothetical protein M426DRAFT_26041 [Hypoxylon sp. CI-4A]|nr:hypothetical protein M426DRAFT_26041 [Hypoxylon sp. CI-4A]